MPPKATASAAGSAALRTSTAHPRPPHTPVARWYPRTPPPPRPPTTLLWRVRSIQHPTCEPAASRTVNPLLHVRCSREPVHERNRTGKSRLSSTCLEVSHGRFVYVLVFFPRAEHRLTRKSWNQHDTTEARKAAGTAAHRTAACPRRRAAAYAAAAAHTADARSPWPGAGRPLTLQEAPPPPSPPAPPCASASPAASAKHVQSDHARVDDHGFLAHTRGDGANHGTSRLPARSAGGRTCTGMSSMLWWNSDQPGRS